MKLELRTRQASSSLDPAISMVYCSVSSLSLYMHRKETQRTQYPTSQDGIAMAETDTCPLGILSPRGPGSLFLMLRVKIQMDI